MDTFDSYMRGNHDECITFMKENDALGRPLEDVKASLKKGVAEYDSRQVRSYENTICKIINCHETLGVIYKYFGDEERAVKMFGVISTVNLPESRFGWLKEEDWENPTLLEQMGAWQIKKGVHLNLAGKNPELARQFFFWAAENYYQSDEIIANCIKFEQVNDIAASCLWRGYALMMLGKFSEALELLKEVVPHFTKHKKSGGDIWQKLEYYLTKAVIPLCEYELSQGEANRKKACKGIEDFVKSFSNNYERMEAYLYYYHLRTMFPDVYSDRAPAAKAGSAPVEKDAPARPDPGNAAARDSKYSFYETHGSVIIFDMESGSLEVFGTNKELEEYVGKVKSLGQYPALSRLFEIYALEEEQDPLPLIEDCERLLSTPGLDEQMKTKTRNVLDVARDAAEADSKVILYFDPEA